MPDGDTGTNLTLTARAVVEALDASESSERAAIVRDVTRAALMGARGNSGVILSQIVRGFAEVAADTARFDAPAVARGLRSASDAAYRAVRQPVEGTMLTVIRELADAAEARALEAADVEELLADLVGAGEESLARTPEQLAVLREAGVVDAGGAGLVEIVRGVAAAVAGEELPDTEPAARDELGVDAIHQELSRFRYCTVFLVEGKELDAGAVERALDPLGDSLLVVGDKSALKVHVHTDDPGAALRVGTSVGVLESVEIANMHRQTVERERRLGAAAASAVVAVVAGAGNKRLFESLGATQIVEGGQSMNPSAAALLDAIEAASAHEVVVLPNNSNVVMTAEQAAGLSAKRVEVVPSESIAAGLAAMVSFDGARAAPENASAMREALSTVATGEVTRASRDADVNGISVRAGEYLGLANGDAVAHGSSFDAVAAAVVERLLADPRDVLTLLTGAEEPVLDDLLASLAERHPEVEIDVQAGGQPHYPLLLAAE